MKALKERILRDGKCFEGGILQSSDGPYSDEIHGGGICKAFCQYQNQ